MILMENIHSYVQRLSGLAKVLRKVFSPFRTGHNPNSIAVSGVVLTVFENILMHQQGLAGDRMEEYWPNLCV